ncbi:MAG: UDP-N-acetylmuramoyl-L-alanyl-D-glutamate--2,6-diaminopimelate ligase [Hyphomonadaceae bacterium]|nr:UDP-N-acetylmuramoyl-L-alanyl-D-glutamate--2,6-diaminopimelate ligase [Hyphomonadaceae bacterium]
MRLDALFQEGVPPGAGSLDVTGLTADSRRVKPGFVFAALAGASQHGRAFAAQAVANGAAAVLSAGDLEIEPGVPHIKTANPRRALALAAARLAPRQPEALVAVTGTNGKSSTVDFLRQIWTHAGIRAASLGTLGAIWDGNVHDLGHTTADPVQIHETLQRLADAGVTHAAMEASSHGLDQHRLDGVTLVAGAFTNLTQDHLDYHGTMDRYRDAKLRLWALLAPGRPAVINADAAEAPAFEAAARARGLNVVMCGWRAGSEGLKIAEIQPRPNGQTLDLKWYGASARVELPLIGEFQALNAVAAAALALSLGARPADVWAGMAALKPVKGRLEHVGATPEGAHVFVDYAHTPHGLEVLLRAARPHAPGRIVLVFGCGGDRDAGKRPQMGAIAARLADVVIVTDDNPRSEDPAAIRRAILAAAPAAQDIGDRAQAIARAVATLQAGDALLIAGKGHETGQLVNGVVHPFADQDVAAAALAAPRG